MAADEDKSIRRIVEQSALIQNISEIKAKMNSKSYTDFVLGPMVSGVSLDGEESNSIINKLYNFKDFIESYNKLTPASLSFLIPQIQIWKIYEDGTENQITFDNYYPKSSINSITSAGSDRGFQANLQSLEFISQGKDTATMFMYQVKMNIIFDSIQVLFNEKSKYLELFNPPKKHDYKRGDFDSKYYQIKLKFGWNFDYDKQFIPENIRPIELKKFADVSGSEMFLNYVLHKITINEDGSVALQVEYIGSIETIARDSSKLSVLSPEKVEKMNQTSKAISDLQEKLSTKGMRAEPQEDDKGNVTIKIFDTSTGQEKTEGVPEKESFEKFYKEQKSYESTSRDEFIGTLIKNISKQYDDKGMPLLQINEYVYKNNLTIISNFSKGKPEEQKASIDVLRNSLKRFTGTANPVRIIFPLLQEDVNPTSIETYLGEVQFQTIVNAQTEEVSSYYNIPFFTFGRLLKAIESLGGTFKTESDFIVLTSDCTIASFGDGDFLDGNELSKNPNYKTIVNNGLSNNLLILENKITEMNISDIPIALSTFKYWVHKNITSQNLGRMSLINFLNLLVTDLLNLALKSSNEDYIPKQNIQFKFFFDRVELDQNNKFLSLIRKNRGQIKTLSKQEFVANNVQDFLTNTNPKKQGSIKKNIIIIYSTPTHSLRKSDFKKDIDSGIPHFFYGQNTGIVNKITFREESMPYVREANIQSQVDKKPWKPGVFLRGKYNVTIEMFGTINFRIGSMIYISPSFPGVIDQGVPIKYGIGGYFVIVSAKYNIESGKFMTILEANWVATGTGEYTNLSHIPFTVIRLSKPA